MKFIIVGMEGESTEPAGIGGTLSALRQQSPKGYRHTEVVPLSLGGNHGHSDRLIREFNQAVTKYIDAPDSYVDTNDEIVKYLVCDYDRMHEHGITEAEFRANVPTATGATPLISKPRFEYLVASMFYDQPLLRSALANGADLNNLIAEGIKHYNSQCNFDFQQLSPYPFSKRIYQSQAWFGHAFTTNPALADRIISMDIDNTQDFYTEIPILLREIAENFKR